LPEPAAQECDEGFDVGRRGTPQKVGQMSGLVEPTSRAGDRPRGLDDFHEAHQVIVGQKLAAPYGARLCPHGGRVLIDEQQWRLIGFRFRLFSDMLKTHTPSASRCDIVADVRLLTWRFYWGTPEEATALA
jgi:hypothetical protein